MKNMRNMLCVNLGHRGENERKEMSSSTAISAVDWLQGFLGMRRRKMEQSSGIGLQCGCKVIRR